MLAIKVYPGVVETSLELHFVFQLQEIKVLSLSEHISHLQFLSNEFALVWQISFFYIKL